MKCKLMCCILVIFINIYLQGCGNEGNAGSMGNQATVREYKKITTNLNITPDYAPDAYLTDMTDSFCYFGVEHITEEEDEEEYLYDCLFYYQSLDTPGEPVFVTKTEGTWVLSLDAYTDTTGQDILCMLTLEEESCSITEYDNSGAQLKQIVISDEEFVRTRPGNIVRCQDGSYIAYNSNALYLLDDEGNIIKGQECPGAYFQSALQFSDGTIHITYMGETSTENYISEVNLKTGALSEKQLLPCAGDKVCEMENGKLLLMDGEALYRYDMTTQKTEPLVENALYNIFKDRVLTLDAAGDTIRILSWERENEALPIELITLTPKTEEEMAKELEEAQQNPAEAGKYDESGKRIITLYDPHGIAEYLLDPQMLNSFNRNNEEYTLVFNSDNPNVETVLAASESPDLMFVFDATSIETYQAAGYLEDMTPYIESSTTLEMSNLQESIVRSFSFDGGLYALPPYCTVETLLCLESQVEGGEGWTVDEFLSWLEKNEMVKSGTGLTRDIVLEYCLKGNLDSYVDFEQREAGLTSNAFKDMLSRIKPLELNAEMNYYRPSMECDLSGVHLYNSAISDIKQITEAEYVLGEELVLKGFPNASGKPEVLLNSVTSLCILEKSECPEGAFAFIEHCLTYDEGIMDGSNDTYDRVLWTVKSRLEMECESEREYDIVLDYNYDTGERTSIRMEITEEQEEKVLEIYQMAEPDTYERMMIRQIILEEVQPYFLGQKDLDTVCEIMQSRVNVLLSERE